MAAVTETINPQQMHTKAQVQARFVKSLASAYRCAEHIGIEAVVTTKLKLGNIQRHVFTTQLWSAPNRPTTRASNAEYRPNRTHGVTTKLDPVVHGDIRLVRPCGEVPVIIWSGLAAVKKSQCREIALDPLGRHCFGI